MTSSHVGFYPFEGFSIHSETIILKLYKLRQKTVCIWCFPVERVNEKYGWLVMLVLGILWLVVGLNQVFTPDVLLENEVQRVTGISLSELEAMSPEATEVARFVFGLLGMLKVSWSFFVIAITITGFRKGETWAWYILWLAPILLVSQGVFDSIYFGDISEMLKWIPILTITLIGLFLPYRKFFPGTPRSDQSNI